MNDEGTKKFNISIIENCPLELELFSQDYICGTLNDLIQNSNLPVSFQLLKMERNKREKLNKIFNAEDGMKYFFAYIKFFEWENPNTHQTTLYGLVGGKTNHQHPDFKFDKNDSNTVKTKIARFFLNYYKLEWSKDIIIVHHETDFSAKQAFFLETFLQRRFHLFDS